MLSTVYAKVFCTESRFVTTAEHKDDDIEFNLAKIRKVLTNVGQ